MSISFAPLCVFHFPLLVSWLNAAHVAPWWAENKMWTIEDVTEKYTSYVQGYKRVDGIKRPLHAFVVMLDEISVGYIQYYNAYDFSRDTVLENLPQSLAALDLYIGDPAYIGKGLAAPILRAFLEDHVWRTFQHCLVDPDVKNIAAIKAYQKAGFVMVKHVDDMVWLVATRSATIV